MPSRPHLPEIATTRDGRDITRGYIESPWWIQPQDRVLLYNAGGNYEIYEDILRDDRVHSAFAQRRAAVVSREWSVIPGGRMRRDRMAADHLREVLDHIRWNTLTNRMLYGIHYGYSIAECLYARDGRHVMLDAVRVRNRRRFVFGPDFRLLLRTTLDAQGEPTPPRKFWTFATGSDHDDEPYGLGLAHQLYWPTWFKKNQVKFWLTALEKWGSPTAVGKYGPNASPQDKNTLMDALRAVHGDTAVRIPESMMIELLQPARSGAIDYEAFYRRMDNAITTIILSQTMTTEDGSSLSQASVHMDVRQEIVSADAHLVDDSFSRQTATWLTEWNYPGAAVPRVLRVMDDPANLLTLAERDRIVASLAGRLDREYIEHTYGVTIDPAASTTTPDPGDTPDPFSPAAGPQTASLAEHNEPPYTSLLSRARETIGPAVDALVAASGAALADADSLTAYRDWLDTEAIDTLDLKPVHDALAVAIAAAHLTGRTDAEDNQVAFADENAARLPFAEQIAFLRRKLSLTTRGWTDIWQEQHDIAFVVAGATEAHLLAHLRTAVDSAITQGTTLRQFRGEFQAVVARYGWSYNGGRDWRARVIYDTNLRTSYAAGRYQQMRAVKALRPYWRYRHSHASTEPREQHLRWDGLILDADNSWWETHYPPNSWGCKCYVETLTERQVERLGGPGKPPPIKTREVIVGKNSATPRTVRVPEGIDAGWAYAPGRKASLGRVVRQSLRGALPQPVGVTARGVHRLLSSHRHLDALSEQWREWWRATPGRGIDNEIDVGSLSPVVVEALGLGAATNAIITITRRELDHLKRTSNIKKLEKGRVLSEADIDRLPEILARPRAVLRDTQEDGLLYIFDPLTEQEQGKVVVSVQRQAKGRTVNRVKTAGYVDRLNLRGSMYELIEGEPDE